MEIERSHAVCSSMNLIYTLDELWNSMRIISKSGAYVIKTISSR